MSQLCAHCGASRVDIRLHIHASVALSDRQQRVVGPVLVARSGNSQCIALPHRHPRDVIARYTCHWRSPAVPLDMLGICALENYAQSELPPAWLDWCLATVGVQPVPSTFMSTNLAS
eukprot:COSAG02_NODE_3634_length_6446_cov_3.541201_5_plen_117_part_00